MKVNSFKPMQAPPEKDLDTQLHDVAKMYEGQFLNEMVKSMRATVNPTNKPSMAEEIYSGQMYDKYVENWSKEGGLGLSDIIYGQLRERYFPDKQNLQRPAGPLPLEKGTTIKLDETKQIGIPVVQPGQRENKDMSYLFNLDRTQSPGAKPVTSPWAGQVVQVMHNDDRQVVKLAHDEGMLSTLSFIGNTVDLKRGDTVTAGQKLGMLSPDAKGLTWQVALLEGRGGDSWT
jgi:flagellar protein FlgJ